MASDLHNQISDFGFRVSDSAVASGKAPTVRAFRVGLTACVAFALAIALAARPVVAAPISPTLPKQVDKATSDSIEKGLRYLANTQRPDGQWVGSGGGMGGSYPTVMTSLAGMAFIAGGSTPESGPYAKNVRRALMYIMRVAESEKDGLIAGAGTEGRSMYGHGFSMLFLSQCYGMDLDPKTEERLRKILDKAVTVVVNSQSDLGAQNNNAGGWIYTPEQKGDEGSVTVTQLQALRGCRNVGIKVPKRTIERAVAYLKHTQNADGGISYSAQSRGGSRPAISAAAIACFYAAGVYDRQAGGKGVESEMVDKLKKYCSGQITVDGNNSQFSGYYFYTHIYYAEALYQAAGDDWTKYYDKMKVKLASMQAPDGSWNGDNIGTTYGTAIATLILQLPYGYLPICQR